MTESRDRGTRDTVSNLEILRKAAQAMNSVLHEPEIIEALLDQAVATLGARAAVVRLLSPDGDQFLQAGARGLSDAYLTKGPVWVADSGMDQRILAGETVTIPDVTRDRSVQYPEAAVTEGLRGMVATPLRVRSQIIGVLRIYVDDAEQLTPEDLVAIDMLADLGAMALEKARLHQSLYRIAEALSASLELEAMLQQVLEATAKKVWLKAASIRLIDPKRQVLHLVAAFGLSEAYLAKGTVHLARSPLDQRVLQGSAVVLYDVEREAGFEYPAEAVLSHLKPQDEILILGPGQAKSQLGHRIEQYGNLKGKVVGLQHAPKLAKVELVFPIREVWRSEKTHEIQVESPSLQLVPESPEQPGTL